MVEKAVGRLPPHPHEGVAILALAYLAGLSNPDGEIRYGVRLVSEAVDLEQGTDAVWVCGRPGKREFLRVDFTTGGPRTVEKKRKRAVRYAKKRGRTVQIVPFAAAINIKLAASPYFRSAYHALTAGARVGLEEGDILCTTEPCPEHGVECSFCEDLLYLGRWLHSHFPTRAQIPRNERERRLRER